MAKRRSSWPGRIAGALVGGVGAYAALSISSWNPGLPISIAIAAAMAVVGFALGARIWQAVVELA